MESWKGLRSADGWVSLTSGGAEEGCHELAFFTFFSLLFYETYVHYYVQVLI